MPASIGPGSKCAVELLCWTNDATENFREGRRLEAEVGCQSTEASGATRLAAGERFTDERTSRLFSYASSRDAMIAVAHLILFF